MSESYCYSTNGEDFESEGFDTREDAVLECVNESDLIQGDTVYTGVAAPYTFADFAPDGDRIREWMADRAYDEAGEYADNWPDTTSAQDDDLTLRVTQAIEAWAIAHNLAPRFFRVTKIEEHKVTEAMLDGSRLQIKGNAE